MWTVISVCFLIVTSIYGITELLRELWLWLIRPKESTPSFITVVLKDGIFAEQLMLYEEYLAWESNKRVSGIIAITTYLSEENRKAATELINKKHNIMAEDEALKYFTYSGTD